MEIFEGNNIGSLKKVEIVLSADVESLYPLTLKSGKTFTQIPLTPQKNQLSIKTEETDNGTVFAYTGKFYVHNIRQTVNQAMQPFLGKRSVMRLTDMNSQVYILGYPGNGVTLTKTASTGENYTSQNGTEFNFSVDMPFEAPNN